LEEVELAEVLFHVLLVVRDPLHDQGAQEVLLSDEPPPRKVQRSVRFVRPLVGVLDLPPQRVPHSLSQMVLTHPVFVVGTLAVFSVALVGDGGKGVGLEIVRCLKDVVRDRKTLSLSGFVWSRLRKSMGVRH